MSGRRTGVVIGLLGLLLAVPGTVVALNELGAIDWLPRIGNDGPNDPVDPQGCGGAQSATITLSTDSARRGASVKVNGSCFRPGERVALRVHVTEVGSATADSAGSFTQTIKIPESAPPPGFPTSVTATGMSSAKSAVAPFSTA
jgi:hypothetical protein